MSGPSLDSFHLAYIPSAEATGDVHVSTSITHKCYVDAVDTLPIPITIRRASSLRLYRCRNHQSMCCNGSEDHDDNRHVVCHPFTENSFSNKNSADDNAEHQQQQQQQRDNECECCCCRAERCSLDALDSLPRPTFHPAVRSSTENNDGYFNSAQSKAANMMLAVLVPSSLTRGLINIISQNSHVDVNDDEKMSPNVKKKNSLERQGVVKQQVLIDAEIELRKSIHPCLLPNDPRHANHNPDCVISNQYDGDHKRCNIQDNNAKPSPNKYPQLSVRGIITSNNVSNCTNFPADAVLLAPMNSNKLSSSSSSSHAAQHNGKNNRLRDHDVNLISHYSTLLNHETSSGAPWAAMKAFPVSTLSILPMDCVSYDANGNSNNNTTERNTDAKSFDKAALPCCPVCLNLIEPSSLGLPALSPQHKCSRWCCSDPNKFHNHDNNHNGDGDDRHHDDEYTQQQPHACANEMKFLPWPPSEANCIACHMRTLSVESNTNGRHRIIPPLSMEMPRSSSLSLDNHGETNYVNNNFSASLDRSITAHLSANSTLTCYQCDMSTTLWACLTCGVVGCGRYTLKHAAEHNALKGHPYSLELATGRIWDYETGNFVHRRDLVECPVLSRKWGIAPGGCSSGTNSQSSPLVASSSLYGGVSFRRGDSHSFLENGNHYVGQERGEGLSNVLTHYQCSDLEDSIASCHNNHNQYTLPAASKLSAQPKKSIMISQEYEALLQSALEDQSQHYEGEISRLRSELASSNMQQQHQHTQVSDRESREIHALQKDSERLKHDVDRLSSALLEAQTKEAKHRSMSQRLLREQSIGKELLAKIREETLAEHKSGRTRMEDLEMQISDLNANLRMMSQFAKNEELKQAQIFGTAGGGEKEKSGKQRGKKNRRGRKKG